MLVMDQPLLSIVIPVGPGETAHLQLVQRLSGFRVPGSRDRPQIVLSDALLLRPEPVPVWVEGVECLRVSGSAGRAAQINRGVAASSGRCLWLLHADSIPGPDALACAAAFARNCAASGSDAALGWFPLAFSADGPRLAVLNATGANLRSRIFGLPFGDQAWLLHRETFDALGGFDETFGRGEDLDFIRRARRGGIKLNRQTACVATSARRYREHGWARTTLAHLWLTLRLWLKSGKRGNR